MSKIQQFRRHLRIRDLVRRSNRHLNMLKIHAGNSFAHEQMKFKIAYYLRKNGVDFYSEPIFLGGKGRADFIVFDGDGYCIEVLESEDLLSLKKKEVKYPLPIRKVYANQEFVPELIL